MKFTKELYDKYNPMGCNAAVEFLKHFGYELHDATESYKSHDIVVKKDNKFLKIEVEVSTNWKKEDEWQGYPSVSCPYRKKASKSDLYIRFNNTCTGCLVVPMSVVHSSPTILKNSKFCENERFFDIAVSDCDFFFDALPTTQNRYIP